MNLRIIKTAVATVVAGLLLFGCQNNEFKSSEGGFEYKYVRKGKGSLPGQGDIVSYNMKYIDEKDSVLFETTSDQPAYVPYDSMQWNNAGPLYKAFGMIKEGDSILIRIPTQTLFMESFRAAVPTNLNPEGFITFCIGAEENKTMEQLEAESTVRSEKQLDKDIEIIDQYLKENNIVAQSTESGLRYVVEIEGNGASPETGDNVTVNYSGYLLDGTQFDSSFDRNEPFTFAIGLQQVIRGWDEGIALFKEGGKGTLYIPSSMAYGERGAGGAIPPNSVLKFDVELIKIN